MSQVKRSPRIRGDTSHYGCLPRIIAQDARQHDLAPDECLIMAVLISAAMVATREDNFAQAMKVGRKKIDAVVSFDEEFVEAWKEKRQAAKVGTYMPAPERAVVSKRHKGDTTTYKRGNLSKLTTASGKAGFAAGLKLARSRIKPEGVSFRVSRRALLRRAHLGTSGQHFARLRHILDRLSSGLMLTGREIPMPPLISIDDHDGDELKLTVSGYWLTLPYVRVPLPWPVRSAPAAALLLVIQCLPVGSIQRGHIGIRELGERIGLFGPRAQTRRAIIRAMNVINVRIDDLSPETFVACEAAGFKIPVAYALTFVGKNAVRINERNQRRRIRVADESPEVDDGAAEADYQAMRRQQIKDDLVRMKETKRRRAMVELQRADHE